MVAPGVLAAEMTFGEFVGHTEKGGTITVTEDTTVNSKYAGTASYMEPKEVVGNYDIELKSGSTLTLHNLNTYNVNITGVNGGYGGNIVINADKAYGGGSYSGGLIGVNENYKIENTETYIKANNLTIVNTIGSADNTNRDGIYVGDDSGVTQNAKMNIDLTGTLSITAGYAGILTGGGAPNVDIDIKAHTVDINAGGYGIIAQTNGVHMDINAIQDITVNSGNGISNNANEGEFNITSEKGNIEVHSKATYGIIALGGDSNFRSNANTFIVDKKGSAFAPANIEYAVAASGNGQIRIESIVGDNVLIGGENMIGVSSKNNSDKGVELIAAQNNKISADIDGAYSTAGTISLSAVNNIVKAGRDGLKADGTDSENSSVTAKASDVNCISAGTLQDIDYNGDTVFFGNSHGAYAVNGGHILAEAGTDNRFSGAVYANGKESTVILQGLNGAEVNNDVYSSAVIDKAGGLTGKETTTDSETGETTTTGMDVVSALYAEKGGQIQLSGINTIQTYYADTTDKHTSERAVWAYDGAKIDIDGVTNISTYSYDQSPNSGDIAIAAGTATELTDEDFTDDVLNNLEKAKVNLNYKNGSSITGDILAAYGGEVNISNGAVQTRAAGEEAVVDGINIHGNLLAGNTGVLNVNLGNGGRLEGRADDYGDAGTEGLYSQHTSFFNPAFSSEILTGGEVNLTMGEGSKWTVTGQSWVTSVDTGNSEHVEIDLASAKSDLNANVQALTIGEMKGNAMFTMKLDGDRSASDMLYMKKANGEYFINLENAVTVEDMYQDGFDGLRFATVGKGSHATFSAGTYDDGVYNVEYEVGTDDYNGNRENGAYNSNSTGGDGQMTEAKPGNDLVDNLFKDEPQEAAAYGIMTLAAVDSPESPDSTEDMGTDTGMNGTTVDDTTNFKLIGVKSRELSDAGKTVVAMSQVNYANAIYMDRLNKRMGEARYIDGDEGLWVRIRHDRIGKSDAFRSKNTMMELGYDKRVDDREDGEHRRGFAIDYMRGTTDYHNVAGDGDVRRGGLWLYDTWLGNKGHYSDYVLKIGRLSNDFEVYARSTGEKITGDYSNFVYSASAEYGRKKDVGKNWYFEPQVQLQYAHVTDADYTTSQGTSVELDAIDSLIGRVGFRLGKDMGENNTFYVKADVLHEFLGDQDISAFDDTGRLDTTYENEGTWYDVGLGFSHQFSKGTYMFLDVEKTFGNDNEDTYQFNVGMNWKV